MLIKRLSEKENKKTKYFKKRGIHVVKSVGNCKKIMQKYSHIKITFFIENPSETKQSILETLRNFQKRFFFSEQKQTRITFGLSNWLHDRTTVSRNLKHKFPDDTQSSSP